MQTKKKLAVLLSTALLATAITGCTAAQATAPATNEATIATYTQGTLSTSSLNERLLSTTGMQTMLDMVDQKILDVVEPVTEEMTTLADSNIENIKNYYKDDFEDNLTINGYADESAFKNSVLLNLQRSDYTAKYIASNVLTEDELKSYYDKLELSIEASHILIQPEDDSEKALATAEQQAKDLIVRINAGEDFAELAKEFSTDPGSAQKGGALGSFTKGQMVKEFEDAAYALEVGAVTQTPVKSDFGYHIIKKTAGEEKAPFEEMKPEIEKTLAQEKLQADPSLMHKALIKLREDNGFKISNELINNQYTTFVNQMNK